MHLVVAMLLDVGTVSVALRATLILGMGNRNG